MESLNTKSAAHYLLTFLKWALFSVLIGIIVGGIAIAFFYGIAAANDLRLAHPSVVLLLPLGGVAIVLLYRICGMEQDRGTNLVLVAVREAEPMKLRTAPLIFLSTILTHFVGGSAGREGAALQLGGSLGAFLGRTIKLDAKDHRVMVMCGMSAAFSALFGTPLTATLFSLEVVSVGVMYYAALVPCMVSAEVAYLFARLCGLHPETGYEIGSTPALSPLTMAQVVVMGLLCALVSILFCKAVHTAPKLYAKSISSPILRGAVGGLLVLALTLLIGNQDYNGTGDYVICSMLRGEGTFPLAFLLKILFTALTLGAGFRGGEIVPVLFTGAALGSLVGPSMGLTAGFGGSLGMVALFCGTTNCPLSSIMLAFELFHGNSLPLYGLCCGVSYMLSGYYGLYSEQKILYSKFRPEFVDKKAK